MENQCVICLKINEDPKFLKEIDTEDKKLTFILRLLVPEIDFSENCIICPLCEIDLSQIYKFRQKCLESDKFHKGKQKDDPPQSPHHVGIKQEPENATLQCENDLKDDFSDSDYDPQVDEVRRQQDNRTHICSVCGKSYVRRRDLNVHEKSHLNRREYKCEKCPKSFNTRKNLYSHEMVVHMDRTKWKYGCEVCLKRFPIKSNFDAHMRIHSQERPFACHLCDMRFIGKGNLKRHIRTHSNIKEFVCDLCEKEYRNRDALKEHKAKVHGIGDARIMVKTKKHFCHLCPKSYFQKNKLRAHLCTHTGEKMHFCRICRKNYSDRSYLSKHMQKFHNFDEMLN